MEDERYPEINWRDRIAFNQHVRQGKPVIKGTRLTVEEILDDIAGGHPIEEVLAAFPGLTYEDFRACVAYAVDGIRMEQYIGGREAAR